MMQVFVYISHNFYIPSAARWHVHKHFKKIAEVWQQVQFTLLPIHTGQAGASREPECCHSQDTVKKTRGICQPQTGWDKQET